MSAMVRLLVLYNPPEDAVAFDKYYNEIHIPLAKQLPGLVRYTISRNLAANAQYYLIAERSLRKSLRERRVSLLPRQRIRRIVASRIPGTCPR